MRTFCFSGFIILALLAIACSSSTPLPSSEPNTTVRIPIFTPSVTPIYRLLETFSIKVDAPALFSEYEANEVAGDQKYKGKQLEVSGIVTGFGTDLFGNPTVLFGISAGGYSGVEAVFEKDKASDIAALSKGQKITILGICVGRSAGDVRLQATSIVSSLPAPKLSPNPSTIGNSSPKIDAASLFAEYEANEVAADLKYKDKQLEVSGTITNFRTDLTGNPVIFFGISAGGYSGVEATFGKDKASNIATLSKGQKITIIGICAGKSVGDVRLQATSIVSVPSTSIATPTRIPAILTPKPTPVQTSITTPAPVQSRLLSLVPSLSASSPLTVAWLRQFGQTRIGASSITLDNSGNIFVAGYTDGSLPEQASSGGKDAFIRKYDPSGSEAWTRQFGTSGNDEARSMARDNLGNIFVVGITFGNLSGQVSSGSYDAFIKKYDSTGNEVWTRQFGNSGTEARSVVADSSNYIYITGNTSGILSGQSKYGYNDFFIRKYDSAGNEIWTRQLGSPKNNYGTSITVDGLGNIYVVGYTNGSMPGQNNLGDSDAFLTKYDTTGNLIWVRQFGTPHVDDARGSATDNAGNIYVTGKTEGILPGQISNKGNDIFLAKYDNLGNLVWMRPFGSSDQADSANSVTTDNSGNIYLTGRIGNTKRQGMDIFIRKYDVSGNVAWMHQFGFLGKGNDYSSSIISDNSKNIYIVGVSDVAEPGTSSYDAYVIKFVQ